MKIGFRKLQIPEERIRHRWIVMLACVNNQALKAVAMLQKRLVKGSHLQKIGPCTHDGEDSLNHEPASRRFLRSAGAAQPPSDSGPGRHCKLPAMHLPQMTTDFRTGTSIRRTWPDY